MRRQSFTPVLIGLWSVFLLCTLLGGLLVESSFAQDFPANGFAESDALLPAISRVSFMQQPADDPVEAGEDVNKSTEDGPGEVVPQTDISMEEYFDQLMVNQGFPARRFTANYTGAQAGQPTGFTTLGAFFMTEAGVLLDGRLHITDLGNVGGSVGTGIRAISGDQMTGVHVFCDMCQTDAGSSFSTVGVSGEWVNGIWDIRATGSWPVSEQIGSASFSSITNTTFVGNSLVGDVEQLQEVALSTVDLVVSRRVSDRDLWAYLGGTNFQAPGEQVWSVRGGAQGRLLPRLLADLHVSNDSMFGPQVGFGISWLLGGPSPESSSIVDRIASTPLRRTAMVATHRVTTSLTAQTFTNPNGSPLVFQHVDSTEPAGGDGSVATPYDTLAAVSAAAQPDDVIYLIRDSIFVGESITLQSGQRLLGESDFSDGNSLDTQFGVANLPSGLGGTNPAQITAAPGSAAVTLASNTTVSNVDILSAVGAGVLGDSFTGDIDLNNLNIQGSGANGITLSSIIGNANISNSQVTTSFLDGIELLDVESVQLTEVLVEMVDLASIGAWGLSITTTGPNSSEVTVVGALIEAVTSSNSFQAQSILGGEMTLRMSGNEADGSYDLLVEPGSFMGIAGNLGVGNVFTDDDNGNLADNGNTTLGGPPTVNAIGEFLIVPW